MIKISIVNQYNLSRWCEVVIVDRSDCTLLARDALNVVAWCWCASQIINFHVISVWVRISVFAFVW